MTTIIKIESSVCVCVGGWTTKEGYAPLGTLILHGVEPQDLALRPQPPPPEEAVHQHRQACE